MKTNGGLNAQVLLDELHDFLLQVYSDTLSNTSVKQYIEELKKRLLKHVKPD